MANNYDTHKDSYIHFKLLIKSVNIDAVSHTTFGPETVKIQSRMYDNPVTLLMRIFAHPVSPSK